MSRPPPYPADMGVEKAVGLVGGTLVLGETLVNYPGGEKFRTVIAPPTSLRRAGRRFCAQGGKDR